MYMYICIPRKHIFYMYKYIYTHTCIFIHTVFITKIWFKLIDHIYVCMYIYVCLEVYMYIFYMYKYVYIYIYIYIYIYTQIFSCICSTCITHTHIYIYTYTVFMPKIWFYLIALYWLLAPMETSKWLLSYTT
jgi:hypothetical protein